jgi:aspartate-semialdehyde dehydrogenase
MVSVGLVGATGNFGRKLIPVLTSDRAITEVRSLSRRAQPSPKSPKVKNVPVNYSDSASLEHALQGCDVLINAMGTNLDHLTSKKALVDAAAKVKVKIYFPRSPGV